MSQCQAPGANPGLPRRRRPIERLDPEERPAPVRGDSAFGNEGVLAEREATGQRQRFKLQRTAGVKRLIERHWQQSDWRNVGEGFDAVASALRLTDLKSRAACGGAAAGKGRLVAETAAKVNRSRCTSSIVRTRSNSGSMPCG